MTGGRVVAAGGVVQKRVNTVSRVLETACVVEERTSTGRRIAETPSVVDERIIAEGCIAVADCVVEKCETTEEGVAVTVVAAFLTHRPRLRRKPKASEREQREHGISNIRYCFHEFISFHHSSQRFVRTSLRSRLSLREEGQVELSRETPNGLSAGAILPGDGRHCQYDFLRIADFNSRNAVSFSSARTTKRFRSQRCASAIQIVRPLQS